MNDPSAGQYIRDHLSGLAAAIVSRQYALQGEVWQIYGNPGHEKSLRDAVYHLTYLAEALEANAPELFNEYLAWVKVLFAGLHFREDILSVTLECTHQVLLEQLPPQTVQPALEMVQAGMQAAQHAPLSLPSFIEGAEPLDEMARSYLNALLRADRMEASRLILSAVDAGVSIREIYTRVFQRTQREIGRLWQTHQVSVAQEHFCTAATQVIMSQLYPRIFTGERKDRRVVVACVGGELHEIGARMIADFFEMEGWDSYFLGANTPPESVLGMAAERKADVLALSATMTFHVRKVAEIIQMLHANSAMSGTRVLVGGYPFNLSPGLWQKVGADGYAPDAESAVATAERILET